MKKNKILFSYFEEHNDYKEEYDLYKKAQEGPNIFYKVNNFHWFLQHQSNYNLENGIKHASYKHPLADRTWLTAIKQYASAGEKWEQLRLNEAGTKLMLDNPLESC